MGLDPVTLAIAGAAIGGGVSAYSSNQKSKAAKSAAEAERDYLTSMSAPSRQLESMQVQDYQDIYQPQARKARDIYLQYAQPQADTANKLYQEQAGLFSDVYDPAYRATGARVQDDLGMDYGLPKELSDQVFSTAKRRISENYAPAREAASQRLAGSGSLGTGIAEQVFQKLGDAELQDLADAAFQQALQEFDIQRTGRQQSVANMFQLLGLAPNPQNPNVQGAATSTGAVGNTLEYLKELYSPPIPKAGINRADVIQGGISGASDGAGFMNPSVLQAPRQVGQLPGYGLPAWGGF